MSPQHVLDAVRCRVALSGQRVLRALTGVVNLLLSGEVCEEASEALRRAPMMALKKPDGGARPIAVADTVRRIASKAVLKQEAVAAVVESALLPTQLEVGTPGGAEPMDAPD